MNLCAIVSRRVAFGGKRGSAAGGERRGSEDGGGLFGGGGGLWGEDDDEERAAYHAEALYAHSGTVLYAETACRGNGTHTKLVFSAL